MEPSNGGPSGVGPGGEDLEVSVVDSSALEALNRSEIDVQIATAKRWPRSITTFKRDLLAQVTADKDTAAKMGYTLPARKGSDDNKPIAGPSVRLAEVAAAAYQNLRVGARIVEIQEKFVVAQGAAHDLEKNIAVSVSISRSIWGKNGRYGNNMIQVTCQAAIAIAFREAVFKAIPRVHINEAYAKAMDASTGTGTMVERRNAVLKVFNDAGITPADAYVLLGVKGPSDIDIEGLVALNGYLTSIEEKQLSWADLKDVVRERKNSATATPAGLAPDQVLRGNASGQDDAKARTAAATTEAPASPSQPAAQPLAPAIAAQVADQRRLEESRGPTTVAGVTLTPDEQREVDEAARLFG